MGYFVLPYRVLFHDTMAYGSHHFLTNFKFQCEAREHLLFEHVLASAADRASCADILFLTQQGYCRNFAPIGIGEKVGILLSVEDPTPSSLRFCFRVVRADGAPATCGFQNLICVSRTTQEVVAAPEAILRFAETLREPLSAPSFADRVLGGRTREVFDEAVLAIGAEAAGDASRNGRFVSDRAPLPPRRFERVLMFPGQGSYYRELWSQLHALDGESALLLERSDAIARELLGASLAQLRSAGSAAEHDALIERTPGLVQLGIYLASVLGARFLMKHGFEPELLAGHSAGEIAALAAGGAFDFETGVALVCHRSRALATLGPDAGRMAALFTGARRTAALIEAIGVSSLEIAVENQAEQTIVSGRSEDLKRLFEVAQAAGVLTAAVDSRYPFHSQLLSPASAVFSAAIRDLPVRPPSIPVYSPMEQRFYSSGRDALEVLPTHFVRRLEFRRGLAALFEMGGRRFVEAGGNDILTKLVRKVFAGKAEVTAASTMARGKPIRDQLAELVVRPASAVEGNDTIDTHAVSEARDEDVAIVALGCWLPAAQGPEQLWENVKRGVSGISDAAETDPELATCFMSPGPVVPDKTYTLLGGFIDTAEWPSDAAQTLTASAQKIAALSSNRKLLARALAQCAAALPAPPNAARTRVLIGSTADGTRELDEAMLIAGLSELANRLAQPGEDAAAWIRRLEEVVGRTAAEARALAPHRSIQDVAEAVLGAGVRAVAVDAACASSMYAIGLGVRALQDGACDTVFAGGVFAPGPANSCLFSQFRGLSSTGSRPFDVGADGVVFSQGAAVVALKRVSDARAAGDHIHAVIRGFGVSSDGKSASVAEPKKSGQITAVRRAWAEAGLEPSSAQFFEAHATSTPVGDAVEFSALAEVVRPADAGAPPIELGSIKALIGHTGWAAGAASVVKVCGALGEKVLPWQPGYTAPNPGIKLRESAFVLSNRPRPWPTGQGGTRRAGINGFGFGGTNAHLILEELSPGAPKTARTSRRRDTRIPLAVVGFAALFPNGSRGRRFDEKELRLPKGMRLMPDVYDSLDPAQLLALMSAEQALAPIASSWQALRDELAVILGVEAKTSRSLRATQRIYLDQVRSRLAARGQPEQAALAERVFAAVQATPSSNPYTLPGLMPNVVAGRVASLFDLHGPNLILDAGESSVFEALSTAERMLARRECKLALAGGISANAGAESALIAAATGRPLGECGLMIAVASIETAREHGFPILSTLTFGAGEGERRRAGDSAAEYLMGAEGAHELSAAFAARAASAVEWGEGRAVTFTPPVDRARVGSESSPSAVAVSSVAKVAPAAKSAPEDVWACAVRSRVERASTASVPLASRKVLLLCDDASALELAGGLRVRAVCPAGARVPGALEIDVASEETAAGALAQLGAIDFDAIVLLKDLAGEKGDASGPTRRLLDLLFLVARRAYADVRDGKTFIVAATTSAFRSEDRLAPATGLFGGFIKSLARELPQALVKAIHLDVAGGDPLRRAIETELGQSPAHSPAEAHYLRGERRVLALSPLPPAVPGRASFLDASSVVLATGGGKGVTAVLIDAVLERAPCAVILIGRTDPQTLPPALAALDDAAFEAFEPTFYREEMAKSPGARIAVLRERFRAHRSAREVQQTLRELRARNARVEYRVADVTSAPAVEALIRAIAEAHRRLDLVVHGAGVQSSRAVTSKTLGEFRAILATKVDGLYFLRDACRRHFGDRTPHFHAVSSAFSFFGNDGQIDYGAANEAINRLAALEDRDRERWSSLAWLGWAEVGMTRGSEYASLARNRRLRPVRRDEGKAIFDPHLDAAATRPPIVVLASQGELDFYRPPFAPASTSETRSTVDVVWPLSVQEQPWLADHRVRGVPTLPGAFEVDLAVRTARQLRPARHLLSVENGRFLQFVQVPRGKKCTMRASGTVIEENDRETLIRIELRSDFTHDSGIVLARDRLHFDCSVRLSAEPVSLAAPEPHANSAIDRAPVADPYMRATSPVALSGPFRCLEGIEIGPERRTARFAIADLASAGPLSELDVPGVLIDAICRFAMIQPDRDGGWPLFVPVGAKRMQARIGNDFALSKLGELTLYGGTPRRDGAMSYSETAEAVDRQGRLVLRVEGLAALEMREG